VKITITGTHQDAGREVSVSMSSDNATIETAVGLMRDALLAWGFQRENIDDWICEE